jgi:hypothetical protein
VALYTIIGINLDGLQEFLGLWACETESAKHWLSLLNEAEEPRGRSIIKKEMKNKISCLINVLFIGFRRGVYFTVMDFFINLEPVI